MCRVAGGIVCGFCLAVPGWRVEGDDVYVEVVGVCGVGRFGMGCAVLIWAYGGVGLDVY